MTNKKTYTDRLEKLKDQINVKVLKKIYENYYLSYDGYTNDDVTFEIFNILDDYEDYDELKSKKKSIIEEITEKISSMFNMIPIENTEEIKAKIKEETAYNIKHYIFRFFDCDKKEDEIKKAINEKIGVIFDKLDLNSDMDDFMNLSKSYQDEIIKELNLKRL